MVKLSLVSDKRILDISVPQSSSCSPQQSHHSHQQSQPRYCRMACSKQLHPAIVGRLLKMGRSDGESRKLIARASESSRREGSTEPIALGTRKISMQCFNNPNSLHRVFQSPWQSVVASCETLANSHEALARNIEVDVERPLREYQTKSREMQGMGNVKGNIATIAKDFDEAQKKADKLQAKGGKADTSRLSGALSGVQEASQQWESQAPFVFEQLQALDENRVNFLRDALTQLQTHEMDTLERSRATAASSLEAILTVSTSDEISNFVARNSEGLPSLASPRRSSRPGTSSQATPATPSAPIPPTPTPETAATLMPPPPTPSMDDRRSEISSVVSGGQRTLPPPPTPGMNFQTYIFASAFH